MTDNTAGRRGRPPRTDPEWARDIQRRVEALEDSVSVRIGDWVLNVRDGDLVATTMSGVTVVLAERPTTASATRTAMSGRGEATGTASQ
jgi:hypothetical protein